MGELSAQNDVSMSLNIWLYENLERLIEKVLTYVHLLNCAYCQRWPLMDLCHLDH